jgi:hypothetical protein
MCTRLQQSQPLLRQKAPRRATRIPWYAMKIRAVSLIAFLALIVWFNLGNASAQARPTAYGGRETAVFGELNFARPGQGAGNVLGGTIGGYEQGNLFGLGLRGTVDTVGSNIHVYQATIGPRVTLRLPKLTVFGELGGGIGHAGYHRFNDLNSVVTSSWGASWQANAGVDWGILPFGLKWRVVEFGYGKVYAGPGVTPKTISTGIVWRLP